MSDLSYKGCLSVERPGTLVSDKKISVVKYNTSIPQYVWAEV